MSEPHEFDEFLDAETPPEPLPVEPPGLPPLMRASELTEIEEDQGDFEPGGLYKGFQILPRHLWPADEWTPRHKERWGESRFYVQTASGTPGLVPWPGSMIVWPWERAWHVDLYRPQVESLLKQERKEKK